MVPAARLKSRNPQLAQFVLPEAEPGEQHEAHLVAEAFLGGDELLDVVVAEGAAILPLVPRGPQVRGRVRAQQPLPHRPGQERADDREPLPSRRRRRLAPVAVEEVTDDLAVVRRFEGFEWQVGVLGRGQPEHVPVGAEGMHGGVLELERVQVGVDALPDRGIVPAALSHRLAESPSELRESQLAAVESLGQAAFLGQSFSVK